MNKRYRSDWTENPIRQIKLSDTDFVIVTIANSERDFNRNDFAEIIGYFQDTMVTVENNSKN